MKIRQCQAGTRKQSVWSKMLQPVLGYLQLFPHLCANRHCHGGCSMWGKLFEAVLSAFPLFHNTAHS